MSKEAYYFSHDANARNDPKILAMRSEFGIQGYGVYWTIIEMLREQEEYKLPFKNYMWNAIAMQVQCKDYASDHAKQFVERCINEYELFDSDKNFFWSNSLIKRMDKKNELSDKRRAAAKARWDKSNDTNESDKKVDANAMQMDANAMQVDAIKEKEIKLKETKVKDKSKEKNKYNEFVSLTLEEYEKLIEQFGESYTKDMIERLNLYKGSTGKKYKSDYMTILAWAKKEGGKTKQQTVTPPHYPKGDGIDAGGNERDTKQTGHVRLYK